MAERRGCTREELNQPCVLSVGERTVRVKIENLSEQGCLVHVVEPGPHPVTDDDLGADASFVLSCTAPARRYTGEIIRRYYADGADHLALRFWNRYTELPSRQQAVSP